MSEQYQAGLEGEKLACTYLKQYGMIILAVRYRAAGGEIDIIAQDGETICFVEVKHRPKGRLGEGIESVTEDKRRRIRRASQVYMKENQIKLACRYDLIENTRAGIWHLKGDQR